MCEATASEAAEAAVAYARRDSGGRDAARFLLLRKRFAMALMTRSGTARILLSSSSAFRTLMLGSSISMFGSRISTVAFPMLVLHLDHSPLVTGLVAFAVIAPSVLFYMPAGVLVDRWNPRRVMLISELFRGLAVASVVVSIFVFGRHTSIVFLILVMVVEEIFEIFFTLADRRYLSRLMERDNIGSQQAYVEVRTHAAILAGRPLGPFLFTLQPLLPFLADGASFLFSIGSLVVLRKRDEASGASWRAPSKIRAGDIVQGFSWLTKDRRAFAMAILLSLTSLIAQALILVFLSDAHSRKLSTAAIGVVLAASGVGGAAGSIFYRVLPATIRRFWLPIQMAAWSIALAALAMAGGLSVEWSTITMLILGFTGAIGNIELGTYLVSNVADDMIARVTGIGQMLSIGCCALGPVLGGAAFQRYGPSGAITLLCVIAVALGVLSLLTPCARADSRQSSSRIQALGGAPQVPAGETASRPAPIPAGAGDHVGLQMELFSAAPSLQEPNRDSVAEFIADHSIFSHGWQVVDHGR